MFNDRQILGNVLCLVYRMVVAAVPLLKFARERAHSDLLAYYDQHLIEEAGHDEMLKADLEQLGITDIPVNFNAAMIAGAQYYLIAHDHPALLLGYMHALEGGCMPVDEVDRLSNLHGVELSALRHHAIHDQQHKLDLEAQIAALPDDLRQRVLWNEDCVRRFLATVRV